MRLISEAPTISGILCVIDACNTQKPLPATEITSMYIDTSSVCLVLKVLNICGTNISVHRNEAVQPNKTSSGILKTISGTPYKFIDYCRFVFLFQNAKLKDDST